MNARKAVEVRRVRVVPRDDTMRELLKHPRLGGFRSKGSIEWPLDTWTKRRIDEGAVKIEERQQQPQGQQRGQHRPQAGAHPSQQTAPQGQQRS